MGDITTEMVKKKFTSSIVPGFFAISDFNNRRQEGQGIIKAGAGAAMNFAFTEMVGFKGYLAYEALQAIPKAAVKGVGMVDKMSRSMNNVTKNTPFASMQFNDTQANYTMRQSGMQLAKASRYNLEQSLLGNEAQYLK